jgi:mercuric ion transport protein
MTDENHTSPVGREAAKETGAILLAIGGLAAAFGAASCCALPILLGSLGLSSAWLAGIALVAAPHRVALVGAAAICLIGAGIVLARYRRSIACAPGAACGNRGATPLIVAVVSLGAALAVAGFVFA